MKTKKVYVYAVSIILLVLLIIGVCIPLMFFFVDMWVATTIVLGIIVLCLIVYVLNVPGHKMHVFYDHQPITKIQKIHGQRFVYKKSKYPFSCGHAVIQMVLETYGIAIDQDEILTFSGKKTLGMTGEELQQTLNMYFATYQLPLHARLQYYTTYAQLFDAIAKKDLVIVMFVNTFYEPGYPHYATYLHFGLLNYINIKSSSAKMGKVIITSPTFSPSEQSPYILGKYEGEIMMSVYEFQERFYLAQKYIKYLRYKPTITPNKLKNIRNRIVNVLFILAIYIGYCFKILQPGLAIFVEKKQ